MTIPLGLLGIWFFGQLHSKSVEGIASKVLCKSKRLALLCFSAPKGAWEQSWSQPSLCHALTKKVSAPESSFKWCRSDFMSSDKAASVPSLFRLQTLDYILVCISRSHQNVLPSQNGDTSLRKPWMQNFVALMSGLSFRKFVDGVYFL